jgi:RNA polymerase sigma-70 factor (ECF subfamily)
MGNGWPGNGASVTLYPMKDLSALTDEQLYKRFRRGDAQAFDVLYTRYRKSLYIYLLRSSPGPAEAEDLYQETWSRIIRSANPGGSGPFKALIFRIARNLQIDGYRRRTLHVVSDSENTKEPQSQAPDPVDRSIIDDCSELLKTELGQLPEEQREAFLLKEETGLTLEQIAEMINVGRETIKSRLRYALKRLRLALEDCL